MWGGIEVNKSSRRAIFWTVMVSSTPFWLDVLYGSLKFENGQMNVTGDLSLS